MRPPSITEKLQTIVDKDECPRKETTLEALAALRPAFEKDGTVTAGNAPGLNTGASAMVPSRNGAAIICS